MPARPADPVRRRALRSCARAIAREARRPRGAVALAVCTHNSRRSQFAEVWLAVALAARGIRGVAVCSGGTEVTAVAPGVVAALRARGFAVDEGPALANPRVAVSGFGVSLTLWSKGVAEAVSGAGAGGTVALMVCAAADASCPAVPRAVYRARLPFADPKSADGTDAEADAYRATSELVEAEMRYVAREVSAALAEYARANSPEPRAGVGP